MSAEIGRIKVPLNVHAGSDWDGPDGLANHDRIILRRALVAALWMIPTVMLAFGALPIVGQFDPNNMLSAYQILQLRGSDSWLSMLKARQWLAANPGQDVYQAVFFVQGVKFQYPCTSLLFIEWLRVYGAHTVPILNLLNSVFFVATAAGMVLLTLALADHFGLSGVRTDRQTRMLLAAVAAVATLCFYPLLRAAALGQIQVMLDALFVFACYSCLLGKRAVAGFLIGLSTLIKPQMGFFLLWGLVRRDRLFILGWSLPVIAAGLASAALYGPGWPMGYLKFLLFIGSHGESFFPNQSVNGLVNRLLQNGPNLDWHANEFPPYNPVVHGATLISTVILIATGLAFGARDRSNGQRMISLAFAGLCFTMASPVTWEHHYGVMLPLFAFCFIALLTISRGQEISARHGWMVLATGFFLAANSLSMTNWLTATPFNVLQSYLLFAAFGMLGLTWVLASRLRRQAALASADSTSPRPVSLTTGAK